MDTPRMDANDASLAAPLAAPLDTRPNTHPDAPLDAPQNAGLPGDGTFDQQLPPQGAQQAPLQESMPDAGPAPAAEPSADLSDNGQADERKAAGWLRRFFVLSGIFLIAGLCVAAPLSGLWLYMSGDLAVDRAAKEQQQHFALFGSALTKTAKDVCDYKLALYQARKPQVAIAGSASMGMLRDNVFLRPVVNMAGSASSLSELRASLDAMLAVHTPQVILIGLDFWWFSTAWEADPFRLAHAAGTSSSYSTSLDTLRLPWQLLLQGKLSLPAFLFLSFGQDRFGIHAQFEDTGFGPDGSWYATNVLQSEKSQDAGFARTLERQRRHIGEFAPQESLSTVHLDAFADIYFRLRGRGIVPVVFLAPLSGQLCDALKTEESLYPHLFGLRQALAERGIEVADTADPRYFDSTGCEFLDGTHAGEVAALRVLRELTSSWNGLLSYLDMEQCNRFISEWKDHASIQLGLVPGVVEDDFLQLGCRKRTGADDLLRLQPGPLQQTQTRRAR